MLVPHPRPHGEELIEAASAYVGPSAAPADAQHVDEWVDETGDGTAWGRYMGGTRRAVAGVEVVIAGWQDADGGVERHASAWADQLDRLAQR